MKTKLVLALTLAGFMAAVPASALTLYTDEASFLGALSSYTVEDFEGLTGGDIQSSYDLGDFTVAADDIMMVLSGATGQGLLNHDFTGGPIARTFTVTFDNAINAFGFSMQEWGDLGVHGTTMLFSNELGENIVVDTRPGQIGQEFYGVTSNLGFTTVTLFDNENPFGQDGYVFDNFTYQFHQGNGVVPEPASMALLGLGLAGMTVRRLRKR